MSKQYFIPRDMKKGRGKVQMRGQVVLDIVVDFDEDDKPGGGGGGGGGGKPKKPFPKIEIPDLFYELKWIAWPGSPSAAFGEAAGYEVVAPDDFSYPPRR